MTPPPSTPPAVPSPVQGTIKARFFGLVFTQMTVAVSSDLGPADLPPQDAHVVILPLTLDASGQREIPDELVERCAKADLIAPYCQTCLDTDVYERQSESCEACATKRARAVLRAALLGGTAEGRE